MNKEQLNEHLDELDEIDFNNNFINISDDDSEDEELNRIINAVKQENSIKKQTNSTKLEKELDVEPTCSVFDDKEKQNSLPNLEVVENALNENETEKELEVSKSEKQSFKLTVPQDFEKLQSKICAKRGRKLIYNPNEVLFEKTFQIIGLDKKNDEGISVKDIIDAEIKEGLRLGYLDKFDGLKTSEIKEEYENDIIFELAEQEFRKMGVILEGETIKVYVYDWDRKGLHHIGELENNEVSELIQYLQNSEQYSFDICGIITGGKAKKVEKDANGKITITKEKGEPIGVELDVTVVKRKD